MNDITALETPSSPVSRTEPLLRTLSPALHNLERGLRAWLDGARRYPLKAIARATFEGLSADLRRQSEALDVERPVLVIMLMGGTGVGKSTLLNALAGGAIAQSSVMRPTTRDPVVYYHQTLRPERLDPALRHCRLVAHDRAHFEQKILVDTPDLDSNDLSNRDKLLALLPVADIVLYVGSQEKYHDKLGWELFLEHRRRRAFAFVLNKWDRCQHGLTSGARPDEDLLRDLTAEGFHNPRLFRTCAQWWVDHGLDTAEAPPDGEQLRDLARWLELGLSRLEIEAIKARGVGQLLQQLQQALESARPPELSAAAEQTRAAWEKVVQEEAGATADVFLNTLEPYQHDIEQQFALEGQRRFRGLMAGYLQLVTRAKYLGSTLRERLPFSGGSGGQKAEAPAFDLKTLTRACSSAASDRHLDARGRALPNRMLLAADAQGFPLDLLSEPAEAAAKLDWRQRYAQALVEILERIEREWARPTGYRRWVQQGILFLAEYVPPLILLASIGVVLWQIFYMKTVPDWSLFLLPLMVLILVLVGLHVLIVLLLPLRWPTIRGEFRRQLEQRLREELNAAYLRLPGDVAETVRQERKQVERLLGEAGEVAAWLAQREQAASVAGLYGN